MKDLPGSSSHFTVSWVSVELGSPLVCMEEGEATKTFPPGRNPRLPSSSGERRKAEGPNRIWDGTEPAVSWSDLSWHPHADLSGRGE